MPDRTPIEAHGWMLTGIGKPLESREFVLDPGPDDVVIKIAGCGVCHTDVSFAVDGVPTRHKLPMVLGHEIAGQVVATGANAMPWKGEFVLVPAVIPCDACAACRAQRPTICRNQFMPGNDGDGGFATHVVVPARHLCPVPRRLPNSLQLADLAVVADAVTTPYEALIRADVGPDDVVVFVGVGGVGGFGVQIAAARGAAVVAIDVDPARLELAQQHGASLALLSKDLRVLKSAVRAFQKDSDRQGIGLKIFETSGTTAGQETAFALLDPGAYLGIVGYSAEKSTIRLSNLMALDATARGNWGCGPSRYPEVLQLVLGGKVVLRPFIEHHPLHEAKDVLAAVAEHAFSKRPVLVPTI